MYSLNGEVVLLKEFPCQVNGNCTQGTIIQTVVLQRNQSVYCRILELDPDRFSATCSCRSSDLKGLQPQNSELDSYFDRLKCQVCFLHVVMISLNK